ncbi:MAG: hypothetical protein WC777_02610 [Candidatus Gracilibacteria bacterium]
MNPEFKSPNGNSHSDSTRKLKKNSPKRKLPAAVHRAKAGLPLNKETTGIATIAKCKTPNRTNSSGKNSAVPKLTKAAAPAKIPARSSCPPNPREDKCTETPIRPKNKNCTALTGTISGHP